MKLFNRYTGILDVNKAINNFDIVVINDRMSIGNSGVAINFHHIRSLGQ
jgi:hypothetical protein